MKKHFEVEHLKYSSLLKEVKDIKKKLSNLEVNIKYHSDVYPTKKELATMGQFIKDLKSKKSKSFTPLEELKRK